MIDTTYKMFMVTKKEMSDNFSETLQIGNVTKLNLKHSNEKFLV